MKNKIFITGYYGFGNTGDEAILTAMLAHLRELRPGLEIVVTSATPEKTAKEHCVESILWSDAYAMLEAVRAADLTIIGGGGLFHDYWGFNPEGFLTDNHWGISFYTAPAVLAAVYGKPLMIYGVGVGPLLSENARDFTRTACKIAAAITVRDAGSRKLLESIGVPTERVTVTADPVFGLSPDRGDAIPAESLPDTTAEGPSIGVALRHWDVGVNPAFWEQQVATALDLVLGKHGGRVVFVPFQQLGIGFENDALVAQRVQSQMRHRERTSILALDLAPAQIRDYFGNCDLVVGMRLHSVILGMLAKVPVLALSYDAKVEQAMERAELSNYCLDVRSLDAAHLAGKIGEALAAKPFAGVEDLAAQARENARIAVDLLQRAAVQPAIEPDLAKLLGWALQAQLRDSSDLRAAREKSSPAQIAGGSNLDNLREKTLQGLDDFQQVFTSNLDAYRKQRAWKAMLSIRKGYTLLTRRGAGAFLKWAAALPFTGPGPLDEYDLRFPGIWNYVPERLLVNRQPSSRSSSPASLKPRKLREILPERKYDVLILAIFDFEFRFQRPQQIASQFARQGHRVFWVSPARLLPSSSSETYQAVPLRDNIWEVRLRGQRPDLYQGHLAPEDAAAYTSSIEALCRDFHVSESCVLLQFPYWRQVGLALRERFGAAVVYDCMDDWGNWTAQGGISDFNLAEERALARECDVLVVSATEFEERYRREGLKPLLVRNGADFEFFASPRPNTLLAGIERPIVGYFGAIADWLDIDLLTKAATARPHYTFVLIGEVHEVNVSGLQALPNVHLLGEKNYREIPLYLSHFDVCLIPFKLNDLTRAVDPVKLYEYLSQGKPVVATNMAELPHDEELLYIASAAGDFVGKIDVALEERSGTDLDRKRRRRIHYARNNTWEAREREIDRAITASFPPISILVVTYNCARFIEPCLESVAQNTAWPHYEVIVADNNSTDGTRELIEHHASSDPRIQFLPQTKNLGFAGANNLAARHASGEYLLFLNPDTIVPPGWLGRLARHCKEGSGVGAVAAVTNFSGNETKINAAYRDVLEMEKFAMDLAAEKAAQSIKISVAPLYCVLVPRRVWEKVGELDADFEVGMFEDDDFSLRVRKAGYRVIAAEDCFVHHFGNGSFSNIPSQNSLRIFEQNKQHFERKWNITWQPHKCRPGVRPPNEDIRLSPEQLLTVKPVEPSRKAPEICRLHPPGTEAEQRFNSQTDGQSAVAIECSNATPTTVAVMGSTLLPTSYGSERFLSARVPPELYAHAGRYPVYLLNEFGESNRVEFEVKPALRNGDGLS